jgi:hypothetical protein
MYSVVEINVEISGTNRGSTFGQIEPGDLCGCPGCRARAALALAKGE